MAKKKKLKINLTYNTPSEEAIKIYWINWKRKK